MKWRATQIKRYDGKTFVTDGVITDSGDSGGPLFDLNPATGQLRIVGELWGEDWEWRFPAWIWHSKYTNVGYPYYRDWLVARIQ